MPRIADEAGALLAQRRFAHDEDGIEGLLALLADHHVAVAAIELGATACSGPRATA